MILKDLKRPLVKINKTKDILMDLEDSIKKKSPFSLIRFGDACLGILASHMCSPNVDFGKKWGSTSGKIAARIVLNQLTIPESHHIRVLNRVIQSANNANYIDSYDSDLLGKFRVGQLAFSWKEIYEDIGITNESYCSTFSHYFSIVNKEYNLFNIMKGRKIFCVNNLIPRFAEKLRVKSKCKSLDFYKIPGRGKSLKHYKNHYRKVCKLLRNNAKNYDLFLIGSGLLAVIYCDIVKLNGGRALDLGQVFHLWNGSVVKSRPSRFLENDRRIMLCKRKKNPPKNAIGVW